MRLDLYLKASRLVIRRPLVRELCEAGKILVNDSPGKPGKDVHTGDRIKLIRAGTIVEVEITAVPTTKQVSKTDATGLYRTISEEPFERDLL
ncbi:MAG: RNA-binding S4 domain-containing protein [Acidobacteria bacterium]|nr:RNA-binding S4 domain-containing protein [Acidobacteriota bacterium]